MKNRLLLLALALLCGAQMQAASWFDRFRSYSPYQWGSIKRYAPENVTSRLAAMRYLYGNDVAQDQERLVRDYQDYLIKKLYRPAMLGVELRPTIKAMEAELLRPNSYYQYQHPDQYILNY